MSLRSLLNRMPYHLRTTLRDARNNYHKRKPVFAGVYDHYNDVPVAAKSTYDDTSWAISSSSGASITAERIGQNIPEMQGYSKALLPLAASLIKPQGDGLTVLDFGGAGGLDYGLLLAQTQESVPLERYHIVDTATAIEAGQSFWDKKHKALTWSTDLPPQQEKFDLVYSYSLS